MGLADSLTVLDCFCCLWNGIEGKFIIRSLSVAASGQ